MTDQQIGVEIQFTTDYKRAVDAFDEIRRAEERMKKRIEEVTHALNDMGATEDEIKRVVAAMREQEKQAERTAAATKKATEQQAAAIAKQAAAAERAAESNRLVNDGGRVGSPLSAAGQLFGDLGIGGSALNTLGGAFDLGEYLGGVNSSLAQVASIALPAATALGALSIAMELWSIRVRAAESGLAAIIATQDQYYQFIATATTEQAEAEKRRLEERSELLKRQQAENRQIIEDYVKGPNYFGRLKQDIDGLTDDELVQRLNETGFVGLPESIGAAIEKFKGLDQSVEENGVLVGRLTGDLQSGTFAANDLAAAERELAAQRIAGLDTMISDYVQGQAFARTATSEQVKERIQAIKVEKMAVDAARLAVDSLGLSEEEATKKKAELNARYDELDKKEQELTDSLLPFVELREREKKALEDNKKLINEAAAAIERQNKAMERAASIQAELARIEEDLRREREFSALEAKIAAAKEAEAVQEKADESAKIIAEYMQAELEAAAEFQNDIAEIEEDGRDAILKIMRDFQDSASDAVLNNDVKQFIQAQRKRDRDLQEQKEAQADELRDRIAAFQQQRNEAQRQHQQQLNDQRQAGQQRILLSQQLEKQLSDLKALYARIDQENARSARIAALSRELADANQQAAAAAASLVNPFVSAAEGARSAVSRIFEGLSFNTSTIYSQGRTITQPTTSGRLFGGGVPEFASGIDYVPHRMLAILDRGERVVRQPDNRGGSGINLDLRGSSFGGGATHTWIEQRFMEFAQEISDYLGGEQ